MRMRVEHPHCLGASYVKRTSILKGHGGRVGNESVQADRQIPFCFVTFTTI